MSRILLSVCFCVCLSTSWAQSSAPWSSQQEEVLRDWERTELWESWIGNLCLPVEEIKKSLPLSNLRTAEEEKLAALDYLITGVQDLYAINRSLQTILRESPNYMRSKVTDLREVVEEAFGRCHSMRYAYVSYQSFLVGGRQCLNAQGEAIEGSVFRSILDQCAFLQFQVDKIRETLKSQDPSMRDL